MKGSSRPSNFAIVLALIMGALVVHVFFQKINQRRNYIPTNYDSIIDLHSKQKIDSLPVIVEKEDTTGLVVIVNVIPTSNSTKKQDPIKKENPTPIIQKNNEDEGNVEIEKEEEDVNNIEINNNIETYTKKDTIEKSEEDPQLNPKYKKFLFFKIKQK